MRQWLQPRLRVPHASTPTSPLVCVVHIRTCEMDIRTCTCTGYMCMRKYPDITVGMHGGYTYMRDRYAYIHVYWIYVYVQGPRHHRWYIRIPYTHAYWIHVHACVLKVPICTSTPHAGAAEALFIYFSLRVQVSTGGACTRVVKRPSVLVSTLPRPRRRRRGGGVQGKAGWNMQQHKTYSNLRIFS
jgi:hypothetical protein